MHRVLARPLPGRSASLLVAARAPRALLVAPRSSLARALSTSSEAGSSADKPAAEETPADKPAAEEAPSESAADGEASPPTEELQARVEELEAQVSSKHDQVLRALAEADNARRRASIDVENAHKFAVGKFAKSLLDVADNLSRAAESIPEDMRASDDHPALKGLYEGVVMTEKTLLKTFEENGMKRMWPIDEKFDPNLHNALFEMPDPSKEPGTVAHVASAGFSLHDRVIRAAGVGIVSKP
jgi:molecular chaperone GrpE